jgi:protein translocase SecG subunit
MLRSLLPSILPAAQILVGALLVAAILFQPSTAGIGGSFGGSDGMQNFHTKRGFEKFLFIATIVLGVLFAGLCVLAVIFR